VTVGSRVGGSRDRRSPVWAYAPDGGVSNGEFRSTPYAAPVIERFVKNEFGFCRLETIVRCSPDMRDENMIVGKRFSHA
jgi:hypothetical protein